VSRGRPRCRCSPRWGLRTDPGNPDVIYVNDSPGTTSQIIRYTISTNTQDSYANYGILDDGSSSQLAFAFSVGFGPDHAMYVGDDPTSTCVVGAKTQTVDFVAKTTRGVPVFGLGIIVNPAAGNVPATSDLYIGDNKGVDVLTNVNTCQPGGCFPLLALNVRGPKEFATDGKDQLVLAEADHHHPEERRVVR
jgi:hypothetical protein